MKILMRVLLGLGLLMVVAVGAGVAFLATLDPNQYREQIASEVKAATGRDLTIKGDLSVGISLIPTFVANDVSFGNATWGSRPEMARLKRLETNLQILPLLSGEIRIGRIVLVEPDILLEVAADGRANWDFDTTKSAGSDTPPTIPVVQSIRIDKGQLRFLDRQAKQDLTLTLNRAYIDQTSNDRLKLDIEGAYNGVPIRLEGTSDPASKLLADASDFAFDLEAVAFAATARLKGTVAKALSAPRLNVDVALAGKDLNATMDAVAKVVPGNDFSALPPLGSFDVSGKATGPATAPTVEGLKFAIGNTDVLRLEGTARGGGNTYSLDRFAARMKGSDLAGTATVRLGGKVPQVTADLASRHFDLDDVRSLMPASKPAGEAGAQKGKAPAKSSDGRVFPADPLPLDGLKAANGEIKLSAAQIVVDRTPINDVALTLSLKDGSLTVDPLRATLAEGRVGGKVALNAAAATPSVETSLTVDKLNLGQLLKDGNFTDQLSGRASSKINVRGSGASVRAIMANLTGTTEVVMDEGQIASQYVELLAADLARRLLPGSGGATKINCFVSRFDIKQGIATSTGLLFDTERMTVAGGGTVDLRQERLDLTINPEPKDASLVSLSVPLQIGGTFLSPTVAPTTASVVKGVAGLAIMGLTPLGALAALAKTGTGDQNPCVAVLQAKPGSAPPQQQPSNPVDSVTKGVQDTFRSIFGGGK